MAVYTKNLAPSWPELVSHRESITQSYHTPPYQAFISLYMSDFSYGPVAGQNDSGIVVARYPRIYKEIVICDPDTNLKAKPNRNTLRFWLHRYHVPVGVTMISIALPRSHRRVTKIFGIFCPSIYCSFVNFYHRFGYHRETITNDHPIPSVKHVKHNAKE